MAIFPNQSSGLNIRVLTLEECINTALEKSTEIRYIKYDLERDQQRVKATRAGLKSNANIRFFLPSLNVKIDEIYDTSEKIFKFKNTRKNRFLSNLRVNQPIATDGNFSLNYIFFYETQLLGVRNFSNYFYLEFVQPIFTPNLLKMNIRRAELSLRRTQLAYESRKLNLIHSITANFYLLYETTVEYEIQLAETKQRETAMVSAMEKLKSGEIDEMELSQLEVALTNSRAELILKKKYLDEQTNWFKQLIGLFTEDDIKVSPNLDFTPEKIDPESMVKVGLNNSIILKQFEIYRESSRLNVIDAQRKNEFKGNIILSLGLDNKKPYFTESFSHFDRTNSIILNFTMPLWDWGRNKAQVASAMASLRRTELSAAENRKSVERELREAVRKINEATNRLNVLKRSQQTAQRSYDISLKKFNIGEISAQDLERAQRRLTRSKLSYIDAIVDYQTAMSDLQRRKNGGFGYIRLYRTRYR
ncbi:MAG: TolC family protein [Candidatus Helarchaeota archaeon]|nr:TolC family protein [Candidatus Helarchaeota archaeon]